MNLRKSQAGFSAVEVLIVSVVVGVVAFAGYSLYNRQQDKPSTAAYNSQSASDVPSAPNINSVADLDKASTTLDQVETSNSSSTDSSQLDAQLATF